MAQYRDLASLIEKSAPDAYRRLTAAHPGAADLLATTRKLGAETATGGTEREIAAARDFVRSGLVTLEDNAEEMIARVSGRLQGARRIRLTGAILAMTSSAGLAASALDLLTLDSKIVALGLSAISFAGAAMAAFSDDLAKGAGSGSDPASLLRKLAAVRGLIAAAQNKRFAFEAGAGGSIFDVLKDLNDAAREMAEIRSLAKAA